MTDNSDENVETGAYALTPPTELDMTSDDSTKKDVDAHDIALVRQLLEGQAGQDRTVLKIPLIFKKLTVEGPPSDAVRVKTLPRAILNTFGVDQFNFLKNLVAPDHGSSANSRKILSDFTGVVKAGEML